MSGVSGIIVAGGHSRRMGRDKRWLEIDGEPMLWRVCRLVSQAADEVIVVTSAVENPRHEAGPPDVAAPWPGIRWSVDRRPDAGPLAGLEAGFLDAGHAIVVVVAADMPWVAPALLCHLAQRLSSSPDHDAAMVTTSHGSQPLLAAYRRDTGLRIAAALLDAGERRLGAFTDRLVALRIPEDEWRLFDPTGASVIDLDIPADLLMSARP